MTVSCTHTAANAFGSKVVAAGTGLLFDASMVWFNAVPGAANSIAPGRRPLVNMCPLVLTQGGRPRLAVGAPGGRRITSAVVQVLTGVADAGLDVQAAIDAPRIDASGAALLASERLGPEVLERLRERGHTVRRDARAARAVPVRVLTTGRRRDHRRRHPPRRDRRRHDRPRRGRLGSYARAARAAAASAGRIAGARRRRTRQVAPLKARLATVAKPGLVLAQREQQVGGAVGGGQRRDRRRARTSSARGGRRGARAARRPPPRARRRAGRARAPGRCGACSSRASWPTRSPSRPSAVASAASSRRRAGARPWRRGWRSSSGIAQRVHERQGAATGRQPGSSPTRIPAVATNGTLCAAVLSVQRRPRPRSARASTGARQATVARSGSAAAAGAHHRTQPRRSGAAGSRARRRPAAP